MCFLRYYIDKIFYEKSKKVEPYLAKGENIIPVQSSLPGYFGWGLLVNLFYILCLLFFCYYRFLRYHFPLPAKGVPFETFSVNYESGKLIHHHISGASLRNQIINSFFGRAHGFAGNLSLDGLSLVTPECKDFIYLPNPNMLPPELRCRDLVSLCSAWSYFEKTASGPLLEKTAAGKRLSGLEDLERHELILLLASAVGRKIYLLDNFIDSQEDYLEISEMVDGLKREGILILDFVSKTRSLFNPDNYYITSLKDRGYVTKELDCRE